jgi:hypothetical protein
VERGMKKQFIIAAITLILLVGGLSGCEEEEEHGLLSEVESHFGICGGLPTFPNELKESGAEIIRIWINWNEIEPVNDDYNWDTMDEVVMLANNVEIEVLGYFINMPFWARNMDNPKCNRTVKGQPIDACELKDWNDFKEFAKNVAERYDGKNASLGEMKYIGIWNEVQGFSEMNSTEYGPWLINGYQAIKKGNPNAQVLLGAVHSPLDFPHAKDFIDTMIEEYSEYYDIFNFHIYQYDDSAVGETIAYMKDRMDYYGVDKPMWLTETATFFTTVKCGDNLSWYDTVAKGVIKRYAQALGNDVEKVFWFAFVGLPTVEEDSRGVECGEPTNFLKGGLGWDVKPDSTFHPRSAYFTYQLMTSKLAGFTSAEKITDTQYRFSVKNKEVYVLWCDSGTCTIPSEISGSVTVTDYLGNKETKDASEVIIDERPIFVEGI